MSSVKLEPIRREHVERLHELRATPEVARWWDPPEDGWPLAVDPDDTHLAILAGDEVAGYLQYYEEPDPSGRYADVDIFLGPEHQDQGLGTEAMRLILRHLIEERGHHRVTLSTSLENVRAIRAYEKVGFRRVGITRKSALSHINGQWEDELLMEFVV